MKLLEQMQALLGVLVSVVVVFLYAQRAVGRTRGKRPTTTNSNLLEVMDEVFSPARHAAAMELRTQQQQGPITPVPEWLPPRHDGQLTRESRDARGVLPQIKRTWPSSRQPEASDG